MDQLEYLHPDPAAGRRLQRRNARLRRQPGGPGCSGRRPASADHRRARGDDPRRRAQGRLLPRPANSSGTLTVVADAVTAAGPRRREAAAARKCDTEFTCLATGAQRRGRQLRPTLPMGERHHPGRTPGGNGRTGCRCTGRWPSPRSSPTPPSRASTLSSATRRSLAAEDLRHARRRLPAWLQRWDGRDVRGSADLAARFVLRADRLLSARGQLGYVTVNTLVEGATLRVGLNSHRARPDRSGGPIPAPVADRERELADRRDMGQPRPARPMTRLLAGRRRRPGDRPGSAAYGRIRSARHDFGKMMTSASMGSRPGWGSRSLTEQKDELIAQDPRNAEVLQPYVIGKDLNQRPDCSPSRGSLISATGHRTC